MLKYRQGQKLCVMNKTYGSATRRGGGTLIFSCIRRLGSFFGVQNFEFQYFGGFRKMNIFGGMKILWIFWGVIIKMNFISGSFICILGSFL